MSNVLKTGVLLAVLTALFVGIGYAIDNIVRGDAGGFVDQEKFSVHGSRVADRDKKTSMEFHARA